MPDLTSDAVRAAREKLIHVVRTDTATNPVCTCEQYPGAFDADGKSAQHERGCAYHHPAPGALWEAYKAEPALRAEIYDLHVRLAAVRDDVLREQPCQYCDQNPCEPAPDGFCCVAFTLAYKCRYCAARAREEGRRVE